MNNMAPTRPFNNQQEPRGSKTEFKNEPMPAIPPAQDFVSGPNVVRTDKDFIAKGFFSVTDIETATLRGQRFARKAVSGNYTCATFEYLIAVTSLAVASSIGLPDAKLVGPGKTFIIKDEAGGAATTAITIRSDGERNIDGAASTTLSTNFQAKEFYSSGNDWYTK